MASGGARNRSGPAADPNSGRSDARGFKLTALPSSYCGPVPAFPLPMPSEREMDLWAEAWCSPQANAWSLPSEAWRVRTVALWVRLSVRCEDPEAPASLLGQLHRFADQIGMTTAGLAEMGWCVAPDEVSPRSADRLAVDRPQVERRLRVAVGDAQ
jgi:hypothetical protein